MTRSLGVCTLLPFLIISCLAARLEKDSVHFSVPKAPKWPNNFKMEYVFTLPYTKTVESGGLRYPVTVWYDGPGQQMRMDVFDGMSSTGSTPSVTSWNLYPRIDKFHCKVSMPSDGPNSTRSVHTSVEQPLPDISSWTYAGTIVRKEKQLHKWQKQEAHGEKVSTYVFYTTEEGHPVRLDMMGMNIMTGSHFDQYILEFTLFKLGAVQNGTIVPPSQCVAHQDGAEIEIDDGKETHALQLQLHTLLPASIVGTGDVHLPTASFLSYKQLIDEWNSAASSPASSAILQHPWAQEESSSSSSVQEAPGKQSFKLSMNHLAHMSDDQYKSTMLGYRRPVENVERKHKANLGTYKAKLPRDRLPTNVDWRGTGADALVKDQASCGSCWAFAATGALQGAWFLATGTPLSFSEQQLVDCSWNQGSNGCYGGWYEGAIEYLVGAGGAVQEEEYKYTGQNMFCNKGHENATRPGKFKGYMRVQPGDEVSLMEAVYLHGPVAVSIDASRPTFRFYSEGVYYDPTCHMDEAHMDHAVLLVGYGTTEEGEPYWLIRNSWSKYWGEDGYIKISRKHDCGVRTSPTIAIVDIDTAPLA